MQTLVKGTKEYLIVDVTDILGTIVSLTGSNPVFDIYQDETPILLSQAASPSNMRLLCLLDTSLVVGGAPPVQLEGEFELYVQFTALPEVPRLGPMKFRID